MGLPQPLVVTYLIFYFIGPSKAQVNCTDNHDGTCSVDYTPTKPGDYDITIKFAGEDIPGTPSYCFPQPVIVLHT